MSHSSVTRAARTALLVRAQQKAYQREHAKRIQDEQFERLRWHIQYGIPQEIRDKIISEYINLLLLPGKIFPQQRPDRSRCFEHFSRVYIRANIKALLLTDRRTLMELRDVYWSHNTWVIGPGSHFDTVGFLTRMPTYAIRLIKSVEINFTIRDIEDILWDRFDIKVDVILGENLHDSERRQLPPPILNTVSHYLLNQWIGKYDPFRCWELDELTLDFTDTVMTDGKYFGGELAKYLAPFVRQFPKQLNIWAPNGDDRDEIYDRIRYNNRYLLANGPR
ncbi:MAG: hypothetical protein Q9186_000990 [Xanthomendoza sp. 1 TL-2023]